MGRGDREHKANLQHFEATIGVQDNCAKAHHSAVTRSRALGDCSVSLPRPDSLIGKVGGTYLFLDAHLCIC